MMDIGLTTLSLLLLVVVLGFWCKINVGFLAIVEAAVLGYAPGRFSGKQIIGELSASLFVALLGVTLLSGTIQEDGCIEFIMRRMVGVFGKQIWMASVLVFTMEFIVAAIGPGCVPVITFAMTTAAPPAHETGYYPVILLVVGNLGIYSGRSSPITLKKILIKSLLEEQRLSTSITSLILNTLIGNLVLFLIIFAAYKGFRVKASDGMKIECEKKEMRADQVIALISIAVMVLLVIFVGMDMGLAPFLVSAVLILLRIGDEKKTVGSVPWNTLLLVYGVGVLTNLVINAGGTGMLANSMSSIMISGTVAGIMDVVSVIMSWFSSAIGIVFPTLIPTVGTVMDDTGGGIQTMEMVSVITLFASVAGLSPTSTDGTIIMEVRGTDGELNRRCLGDKLFAQLLAWVFITVGMLAVMASVGVLDWSGQQKLENTKKHS